MASNKPVDNLVDSLKGLVIGASGNIPGHLHGSSSQSHLLSTADEDFLICLGEIKHMVEECGATFERLKVNECTHLVTTESSVKRKLRKSMFFAFQMFWILGKVTNRLIIFS
jgi:poly [ADP-ribose] polymerase